MDHGSGLLDRLSDVVDLVLGHLARALSLMLYLSRRASVDARYLLVMCGETGHSLRSGVVDGNSSCPSSHLNTYIN